MMSPHAIYEELLCAPVLSKAVSLLADDALRSLQCSLARGDIHTWPAELIHGQVMVECCDRFCRETQEKAMNTIGFKNGGAE